ALAQRPLLGDAVADDVVDRGADGVAVALVEQRGRNGVVVARELVGEAVEGGGGDARAYLVDQQVERLGGQPAGLAHAGKARLPVEGNDTGGPAVLGFGVDIGDHGRLRSCRQNSMWATGLEGRRPRAKLPTAAPAPL